MGLADPFDPATSVWAKIADGLMQGAISAVVRNAGAIRRAWQEAGETIAIDAIAPPEEAAIEKAAEGMPK
jgi:hypothetical protein